MNYTAEKRHKFKTLLIHLITTLPYIFLGWPGLKAFKATDNKKCKQRTTQANEEYRKIPKISPSKYKPPKLVTQKTLR